MSSKHLILKSMLHIIIAKFGIELINEKLAEIFTEDSEILKDYCYDDLAEAYDNINKNIKYKETMRKMRERERLT